MKLNENIKYFKNVYCYNINTSSNIFYIKFAELQNFKKKNVDIVIMQIINFNFY